MLRPLLDRKSLLVLGLNSGTSADGLDLALVRVTNRSHALQAEFIHGRTVPYSKEIRKLILQTADSELASINDVTCLNNLLGQLYGRLAKTAILEAKKRGIVVDLVASHGQTIRHLPKKIRLAGYEVCGTVQIGSMAQISALTNCVTVGDFRQGDIALRGEGAPITVAAMRVMFGSRKQPRLIVNVGGMSNYFYFPAGQDGAVRAADCGPGNVVSDLLCQKLLRKPYDVNGARAGRGQISQRLLSTLMASHFFTDRSRSTGREEFGDTMAGRIIRIGKDLKLSSSDLIATSMELTAIAIARSVRPLCTKAGALYLTGGGSHNKFLCRRLSEHLPGAKVVSVSELGMDPDLVEATAFAVMGAAAIWSVPLPTRFDGKQQRTRPVLGLICQPPSRK